MNTPAPEHISFQSINQMLLAASTTHGFFMGEAKKNAPGRMAWEIRLFEGQSINFVIIFDAHLSNEIYVGFSLAFRWEGAEKLYIKVRRAMPCDLPTKIKKIRGTQTPIAQLSITGDPNWFNQPAPIRFSYGNLNKLHLFIEDVFNTLSALIVPKFQNYCDEQNIARAALIPAPESKLELLPITTLVILVAADKFDDYLHWRDIFLEQKKLSNPQRVALKVLDEEIKIKRAH